MKKKNVTALMIAAALTCGVSAQSKKPVVPATATPVKTVKVLTSRLAAAARAPLAAAKKEDPKAKKNLSTKAAAKPLATTKLATRKNAASEKALSPAKKTKPGKAATETKLAANDLRTKTPPLRAKTSASSEPRKGKFGKDVRLTTSKIEDDNEIITTRRVETKRTVEPALAKRQAPKPEAKDEDDEAPLRRLRPRIADDESKDILQERTKDNATDEDRVADAPKVPIARPDRIEVIEPDSPQIEQLQALRNSRPLPSYGAIVTRTGSAPTARKDISIPQQRVFEIQYELAKRGFFTAEPNGLYDNTTVAAMWEFQKNYGLPATGYPTAHALKRLGLTSW